MSSRDFLATPIGVLQIEASTLGITDVKFVEQTPVKITPSILTDQCKQELAEYFFVKRTRFAVSLDLAGRAFQVLVWESLKQIPYGETRSYQDLAMLINNPKAQRAVGGANNQNPVAIIIPCHRVVGKDGDMRGYAAGVDKKAWLLAHERQVY